MSTKFIYTSIVLVVFILTQVLSLSTSVRLKENGIIKKEFSTTLFYLSFFVLCFFVCFTDSGADYINYYQGIENETTLTGVWNMEDGQPLFAFWSYLGMKIFINAHVVIFSMKAVALLLIFRTFYILRLYIDIPLAIFAYVALLYFDSMYLISIHLATAFEFYAFALLVLGHNKKSFFFYILAIGLHFSSVVSILTYMLCLILVNRGKVCLYKMRTLIVCMGGIILFGSSFFFIEYLVFAVPAFSRYAIYLFDADSNNGGIFQYFIYFPPIIALYYLFFKEKEKTLYKYYSLIFTGVGFSIAMIAYHLPILTRVYFHYSIVFILFLPYAINRIKISSVIVPQKKILLSFSKMFLIIYFAFRLFLTLQTKLDPMHTSELLYYRFFIPFS